MEQITNAVGFVPQMLHFCALDAQAQGKKDIGFSVLKDIVRQYDTMSEEVAKEIRLPVLHRYLLLLPPLFGALCLLQMCNSIYVCGSGTRTNFRCNINHYALQSF